MIKSYLKKCKKRKIWSWMVVPFILRFIWVHKELKFHWWDLMLVDPELTVKFLKSVPTKKTFCKISSQQMIHITTISSRTICYRFPKLITISISSLQTTHFKIIYGNLMPLLTLDVNNFFHIEVVKVHLLQDSKIRVR